MLVFLFCACKKSVRERTYGLHWPFSRFVEACPRAVVRWLQSPTGSTGHLARAHITGTTTDLGLQSPTGSTGHLAVGLFFFVLIATYHYSGTFNESHFPWSFPWNLPRIRKNFVHFASRCDTLEGSESLCQAIHRKREKHEASSPYHSRARRDNPESHVPLARELEATAPASASPFRAPRTLPACLALPASRSQRDSPQKWVADRRTRPVVTTVCHPTPALPRHLGRRRRPR